MSGHGYYPPPGQPPAPPPGPQAYPPAPYGQPGYPIVAPAAHKPGAIPLRPLGLGDMYDGAFKIIRFNPRATLGSAVLVTAVAMLIPVAVTGVLSLLLDLSSALSFGDDSTTADPATAEVVGSAAAYVVEGIGQILQVFGLIFVTGMVVHVTAAAAVGRKLSLTGAWAATHGKRWRLVGLFLLALVASVTFVVAMVTVVFVLVWLLTDWLAALLSVGMVFAALAAAVFFWVRVYYLAVPPLMLEPVGVFGALRRSWALTSRQFWRTFGIALLTGLVTQIAGGMLGVPFSIVGMLAATATSNMEATLMITVVANAVAAVVSAAFVAPFTAAVASLQYVDQRIRKEGYDVELMTRAGIVGP
jgi:hypothetical protein